MWDRSMVHMYEPVILVLLSQRGEVAVDLVLVATGGTHLNRQMLDAEICADPSANGMEKVIGQCRVVSIDEYMTGHHNQARFNRPDMEVVDVFHTGDRLDGRSHV